MSSSASGDGSVEGRTITLDLSKADKEKVRATPGGEAVLEQLREVVVENFHVADNVTIELPPSALIVNEDEKDTLRKLVKADAGRRDLHGADAAELGRLAFRDGKRVKLSGAQLSQVFQTGTFTVDSVEFPGEKHTWELSHLLQKGQKKIWETARSNYVCACKLICLTCPNRLWRSDRFSVRDSFQTFGRAFYDTISLLIGLPERVPMYSSGEVNFWLHIARQRQFLETLERKKKDGSYTTREGRRPIDLTLANLPFEEAEKLSTALDKLDQRVRSALNARERTRRREIAEELSGKKQARSSDSASSASLKQSSSSGSESSNSEEQESVTSASSDAPVKLTEMEIAVKVEERLAKEENEYMIDQILNGAELKGFAGLRQLIADDVKALYLVELSEFQIREQVSQAASDAMSLFVKNNPVRGRIADFVVSAHSRALAKYNKAHRHEIYGVVHGRLEDAQLLQQAHFTSTTGDLIEDEEKQGRKMEAMRGPATVVDFRRYIWAANSTVSWHVKDDEEMTMTHFRDRSGCCGHELEKPEGYRNMTHTTRDHNTWRVSSSFMLWRLIAIVMSIPVWLSNVNLFFVMMLWSSPLSLRTLFGCSKYSEGYMVDSEGAVVARPKSEDTLGTLLASLWRNVSKSRRQFEEAPDNGILGKSFTRLFNVVWNYLFKGLLGSLLLIVFLGTFCVLNIVVCLVGMPTSFIWVPIVSLLAHLFCIFVFDYRGMDLYNRRHYSRVCYYTFPIFGRLFRLAWAFFELVVNLVLALVVLPLLSLLVFILATLRQIIRRMYDCCCFCCCLYPKGRVPSGNNFLVRRVAGPQLNVALYSELSWQVGLVELRRKLEFLELEAYRRATERKIREPAEGYRAFFSALAAPFGVETNVQNKFDDEHFGTSKAISALNAAVDARRKEITGGRDDFTWFKFSNAGLMSLLRVGEVLVKEFVASRILPHFTPQETTDFWENYHLGPDQWAPLTNQLLIDTFGAHIIESLEDNGKTLTLEVEHVSLDRFVSMVLEGDAHDDLDQYVVTDAPQRRRKARAERIEERLQVASQAPSRIWARNVIDLDAHKRSITQRGAMTGPARNEMTRIDIPVDMLARWEERRTHDQARRQRAKRFGRHSGSDTASLEEWNFKYPATKETPTRNKKKNAAKRPAGKLPAAPVSSDDSSEY